MKILGWINGWRDAPHCWKRFLFLPIRHEYNEGVRWGIFTLFGIGFFYGAGE